MFWSKHYSLLLLVLIASFAQIISGKDVEDTDDSKVQLDDKTAEVPENKAIETEQNNPDDVLGQSLMTMLSQNLGQLSQGGVSPMSGFGAAFPALNTFLSNSWPGLNPLLLPPNLNLNNFNLLGQVHADQLPAASKVMLVLADEQQKYKRSPILNGDLLRQIRQTQPGGALFNQAFFTTLIPNSEQLLQQFQQTSDMLSQTMQQVPGASMLGQAFNTPQPDVAQEPAADGGDAGGSVVGQAPPNPNDVLGVILNQFNNFGQPLMKMMTPQAASSDISEVRMLPENNKEMRANNKMAEIPINAQLMETLNDKRRPILWFRNSDLGNQMTEGPSAKKTPEEEALESQLIAFERQVIKELKMLQEIDREAHKLRAAAKDTSDKVSTEPVDKLSYSLSEKPLHKITCEDVEKVLSDKYVLKMLQKKFSPEAIKGHQQLVEQVMETSMPIKRQTPYAPFWDINTVMSDPKMANMMAYALRSAATGTKDEVTSPIVGDQKLQNQGVMEFTSPLNTQSVDNIQRQWMEQHQQRQQPQQQQQQQQQQFMNDQQVWVDEKMKLQQEMEQARRAQEAQMFLETDHVENENEPRHSHHYGKLKKGKLPHYGLGYHYGFGYPYGFGNLYGQGLAHQPHYNSYGNQGYSSPNYGSQSNYGAPSSYGHKTNDYAAPSSYGHQTHFFSSHSRYGPPSTYKARTAVGNDEIEAMLQNDKTLMKINSAPKQIPQGEWTQETEFKNNDDNSKAHNVKSTFPTSTEEDPEMVGAIFGFMPDTLLPFMGLLAVDSPNDPWYHKPHNLYEPIFHQSASYEPFLLPNKTK